MFTAIAASICSIMDNLISGRWTGNAQLLYVNHPRYGGSDVTLVRAQCALAADMRAICARGSYESVQLKWRLEVTVLALLVAAVITSVTITAQRLVVSTLVPAVMRNLMIVLDARPLL